MSLVNSTWKPVCRGETLPGVNRLPGPGTFETRASLEPGQHVLSACCTARLHGPAVSLQSEDRCTLLCNVLNWLPQFTFPPCLAFRLVVFLLWKVFILPFWVCLLALAILNGERKYWRPSELWSSADFVNSDCEVGVRVRRPRGSLDALEHCACFNMMSF